MPFYLRIPPTIFYTLIVHIWPMTDSKMHPDFRDVKWEGKKEVYFWKLKCGILYFFYWLLLLPPETKGGLTLHSKMSDIFLNPLK